MILRALAPVLGVAALGAGCAGDGVTPKIHDLTFDGQAPDSPLVVLLSFAFEDDDADLSGGELTTFINGRATSARPLAMLPLFLESDVDPDATEGRLEFVLELSFANGTPDDGTSFTIGARAEDAQRHVSTTQETKLKLESE